MLSRFRLELDVVLETANMPLVIEKARQHYAAERTVETVDQNGTVRDIPVAEFIGEIEDALMELAERNPLFINADLEIDRITCTAAVDVGQGQTSISNAVAEENIDHEQAAEPDIEEYESGLYLCRWPNGDFSLVKADDRKDAILQLDEWAGAEPAWLIPMDTSMIDFRLNDRGEIELVEFAEETGEFIWEKCYPELDQVLSSEAVLKHLSGKRGRGTSYKIRKAVEHERKRLWHAQGEPTPARTALGRELQKHLGTVGPVADRYVEVAANEILRAKGGDGKPN